MIVNLNDKAKAKLTDRGKLFYRQYYNFMDQGVEAPDVWEGQLWEMFHIFGHGCMMGNEVVFERCEIELLEM